MPKKIKRSLRDYLSKIKNPHPQIQCSLSSSKNWILSGCKHPKTPSFAIDNRNEPHVTPAATAATNNNDDEATLADIDRFLFENFKSLYLKDDEETDDDTTKRVVSEESRDHEEARKLGSILFDSPPQDLLGSNRFFLTPGFSGTLVEDEGSSSTSTLNDSSSNFHGHVHHHHHHKLPDNCVALLGCSPSPYDDFRHSMHAVVEARLRNNERVDWDFMEELLFCYLNLNDKKSYKFILSAFVDLIVLIRRRSETAPVKAMPRSVRTVKIGREVRKKKTKEVTLEFGSS